MVDGLTNKGGDKKRFISGARCPDCNVEDELVMYVEAGRDAFECLSCGYKKHRPTVDELQAEKNQASDGKQSIELQWKKP